MLAVFGVSSFCLVWRKGVVDFNLSEKTASTACLPVCLFVCENP